LFVPSSLAHHIASPGFMRLLENNTNSILVIEDAENVLQKRGAKDNDVVSTILNLTDGLLADCYKIQVLCTFNTELANIDEALLRKGRLIAKYEFNELSLEKSKLLAKKLSIQSKITQPMLLTDLFNFEEKTYVENKKSIGFKKALLS
jgi:SpoVK/Ycf46/Vps4 family AAA+-type ATPase